MAIRVNNTMHFFAEVNTRAKCALNALALRDWDREAQEFVKKRRNIEQLSQQL